jgi:hypothetical protein
MTVMSCQPRLTIGDEPFDCLERIIIELDARHDELLALLERKRQAIARADADAIHECCRLECRTIDDIRSIEAKRQLIVRDLALAIGANDPGALGVEQIAAHASPEQAERLLAVSTPVKSKIERLRQRSAVLKQAAEALSRHMSGVMQSVHAAMAQTRVYGRQGRLSPAGGVPSMLDLTS